MRYRILGQTGVRVSALCFGTMSFGDEADEPTAAAMFAACRDVGVNFFDCADVYGDGAAEQILGRLISDCRDEVVVATKMYYPTGSNPNARGASRYHMVRAVEASLRRLGTDYVDIYYLHGFDPATAQEETLRGLELLVQQGKILYPAASNFSAWQAAMALGIADRYGWARLACLQPMYNLAKRQAEVEILPLAQSEELGVVTYSPLGGGLLSGKYGVDRRPPTGRLVDQEMYSTRYGDPSNFEIASRFSRLAEELGHPPVALAIAWAGSHPAVTASILGARNLDQLTACLESATIALSDEDRARISALSPTPPTANDRNDEPKHSLAPSPSGQGEEW